MWRKSPTLHRIYGGIFRPWRIYPHSAPDKQAYRSSSGVCAADSMSKRSSSHFSFCSVREVQRRCTSLTEAYRSGHNEAVLKTVWGQPHGGSNPSASAKKEVTFVYQKLLLFLSKPQAWYIITRQRASHQLLWSCISSRQSRV